MSDFETHACTLPNTNECFSEHLLEFAQALHRGEDEVESRVRYLGETPEFSRRVQVEITRMVVGS